MSTTFYAGQTGPDAITNLNLLWDRVTGGLSSVSTTSLTIGTGTQSLTIEANKAFAATQTVKISRTSDPTKYMAGTVTSYNSTTGALIVNALSTNGAGTFTDWTIVLSGEAGANGATGSAATIAVGTVTTLAAGASATVTNAGTSGAAVFNFGIPQGAAGSAGSAPGSTGYVCYNNAGVFDAVSAYRFSTTADRNFIIQRATKTSGQVGLILDGGTGGVSWQVLQNASDDGLVIYGNGNTRFAIASNGQVAFGYSTGGSTATIVATAPSSGVNYFQLDGAVTGGYPGLSAQGSDTNIGLNYLTKGSGTHAFYSALSLVQFTIAHTASAVNNLQVTGAATGIGPSLSAIGTDSNVGMSLITKGSGSLNFYTGGSVLQAFVPHVASAVNYHAIYGNVTTGGITHEARGSDSNISINLISKGTGSINLYTNGSGAAVWLGLAVIHAANVVNYPCVSGAATGTRPKIFCGGTDANIGIEYAVVGSEYHAFTTNGGLLQFAIAPFAGAVNYFLLYGSTTGNGLNLTAAGTDSNISILMVPKGTSGAVELRNSTIAQALRAYNTYTDASNYERGIFSFQAAANVLTIGAQAAGTGTLRAVNLIGSAVQINGVVAATISDTQTLTNKRVTARTGSTASSATPTINTDNTDIYRLTALAVDITSFTTNLTGTPAHGDVLVIEITGTATRAITWGASFEASTVALPTTTVSTAMLQVSFMWNSGTSKWRCVGSC